MLSNSCLDSYEIEINGKLIFSKHHLGEFPDNAEIVEISKWGNKGKSFLHMYLCSVAEGGEPRMVITDRKNTPLAKEQPIVFTSVKVFLVPREILKY